MDQFGQYESLYFNLSKKDESFIENSTRCLFPCSYPEYRVADKSLYNTGTFGLFITFGSVAVTVKEEVTSKSRGLKNPSTLCSLILRFTVTLLSRWSPTLGEASVSSSVSLFMQSGTSSRTGV